MRAIRASALDPFAYRGLGQVHVAGHGPDRLPLVKYQAHDAGFVLVSELAARPPLRCVGHRSGHRIPHRKDVHRFGSSPKELETENTRLKKLFAESLLENEVTRIFASWNQTAGWLRGVEALKAAA